MHTSPHAHVTARGSSTEQPITALLDLLGRRSALRVLWELRDGHPQTFRTLRASCGGVSPSVLNARLKELRQAGLLTPGAPAGYRLTEQGLALVVKLGPLKGWANRWVQHTEAGE